ncbi:MAG TPA: YbfB/YjiJ family MFS transporter [Bradyrhizobium sp.]|jgi:MFS family permease
MHGTTRNLSATSAVLIGTLALASAMGIGRFSLTPIMPLMQQDLGLTLSQGSLLATANYLGYLFGALVCAGMAPRSPGAIRWGLVGVGVFTLAMAPTHALPLWFAFRFAAGVASAFVLIGVSAWAMPILAYHDVGHWSGRIFAGVGLGIAFAGLVGLAAAVEAWSSQLTWIALGIVASMLAVALWSPLKAEHRSVTLPVVSASGPLSKRTLIVAACYSAFGYGYIIPATFLPSLARGYVNDPAVFGMVWPVFGLAAAISTVAGARLLNRISAKQLWTGTQWVLIAGVLAPVLAVNVATLSIAALCVGGSFMVITLAGIKEAMRLGGAHAARAVGMMTAGFGIGQIAGPLIVALFAGTGGARVMPSLLAVLALVVSNVVLYVVDDGAEIASQ